MAKQPKSWKRGLLKAWLALSLVWAAGLTLWVVRGAVDLAAELEGAGWLIAAFVFYILPLGALPCLVVLFLGWVCVKIFEVVRGAAP